MSEADSAMLRRAWEAFTRGDIDAATEILDPDLRWYGASDPDAESACHSRTDARAFTRRALADGVSTELLDIDERTYVGDHEGDGVASNILGDPREAHYEAVPRVTYTDP